MKRLVIFFCIIFTLLIATSCSALELRLFPTPAKPDQGKIVDAIDVAVIVASYEYADQIIDAPKPIHIKFETYILYPKSLIKRYLKSIPRPPYIPDDTMIECMDQDYYANWYYGMVKMFLPGSASFQVMGKINKLTMDGDQLIIGIISSENEIVWVYGDPYWYLELTDLDM